MSENTDGNINANTPLMENEYVQQLFSVMQENERDTSGLSALLGHVSEMENFVKRAEDKIADMKSQLAEMKEVQNHPVKTALQSAIRSLENKVAEVKEQLATLKSNIVLGCKNAVEAFKDKGVAALDKLASFFRVKGALKAIDRSAEQAIKNCDKSVSNINAFANEYHSAGRAIKNMGRVLIGKEPIDAKKEAGKLSKAIAAPYKAQKAVMTGLKDAADKAIAAVDRLSERQAERKAERQGKRADTPDMLAKITKNKERVEREKLELPVPDRAKSKGAEL
jgi:hypothetical protein